VVTNHGLEPARLAVELRVGADFADLFEVKEGRVQHRVTASQSTEPDRLTFDHRQAGSARTSTVRLSVPAEVEPGRATWSLDLAPTRSWEVCCEVAVTLDDEEIAPRFRCGGDDHRAVPTRRLARWRASIPTIETDSTALATTLERSREDLGALRIFDPDHTDIPIVAAGAPWFMTVFGRDSLLTAWMALIAEPRLAAGVLSTLARFQGRDVDPRTEEQPGRILHEMRFGSSASLALGGGQVYYGSVDATPLFVMLLGELRRWHPDDAVVADLLPHADHAMAWIERWGDLDGDGFVEYHGQSEHGLRNQGWKDSWDAIRHADGRLAEAPIALAEVQGYVYGAYVARAHLATEAGDVTTARRCWNRAAELRRRFDEAFWVDELGTYALALDADKRQVAVATSNIGHCLWTGIVAPERAESVADRLLDGHGFSGWGVRTLATSAPAHNPVSYHNGSVWPHDNAVCAAGLARYGLLEHARPIIAAQLSVAERFGGRLPELFAGFDRAELAVPAPYPTSCSPQAWAAASPLLWLRTMLRFDPAAPHGEIWVAPALPAGIGRLRVQGIRVGRQRISVTVEGDQVEVDGTGSLRVHHRPRPPLAAAH
jgi:glycogen debranching enzyme